MGEWIKGKIIENKQWNERLFSLKIEADTKAFKSGQFIRVGLDIGEKRIGRPYSCVNTSGQRPFEIYFNIVPEGPLTPLLAKLQAGDELFVWDTVNGLLTVEDVPQASALWMFATGTGLGPFLSILKTKTSYDKFSKLVLVHAVRTAEELTYSDMVKEILEEYTDSVVYVPIVSREQHATALKGRIPDLVKSGELEEKVGIKLSKEDSHVMLCGNSGMIQDTMKVLGERGMVKHTRKEPGHISMEKYH